MRADHDLARRIALLLAVPVAGAGLIGLAQLVAPADTSSGLTQLTGADGKPAASSAISLNPGDGDPRSQPDGDASVATGSSSRPAAAGRPAVIVRGRYVLRGPAKAPAAASVVFVLQGPTRLVRVDRSAPFAVPVDTRTIPDGSYRLIVETMVGTHRVVVSSALLTVANHGAPAAVPLPGHAVRPGPQAARAASGRQATRTGATPRSATARSPQPVPQATSGTQPSAAPAAGSFDDQVVALTNAQRTAHGCSALTVNATLTSVARAHSQDMATRDYFDHADLEGRSPFDRMTAAGYRYSSAAENIAAGQRTPAAVVDAWMNSAGHRANILNCGLTQIGVGYATGGRYGTYWTQDFGTPR